MHEAFIMYYFLSPVSVFADDIMTVCSQTFSLPVVHQHRDGYQEGILMKRMGSFRGSTASIGSHLAIRQYLFTSRHAQPQAMSILSIDFLWDSFLLVAGVTQLTVAVSSAQYSLWPRNPTKLITHVATLVFIGIHWGAAFSKATSLTGLA